jgi:hypothetical protein
MTEVMLREISSGPALVASQIAAFLVHKKIKKKKGGKIRKVIPKNKGEKNMRVKINNIQPFHRQKKSCVSCDCTTHLDLLGVVAVPVMKKQVGMLNSKTIFQRTPVIPHPASAPIPPHHSADVHQDFLGVIAAASDEVSRRCVVRNIRLVTILRATDCSML